MLNMKLINYSKTVAVVFPSQKYKEPATLVVSRDRPIYQPGISGWYFSFIDISGTADMGFTDISVSAKMADIIGLSRCWQNAVIFLTHADNLRKKAQRTKSRHLSCSNANRYVFIDKQTRWTIKHASAIAAKTKASSLIRLIKNRNLKKF